LPGSGPAKLVAAYTTAHHQIVLCRTASGQLYYYGQVRGKPNMNITLPAQKTPQGYFARNVTSNGTYGYAIRGKRVIITRNGTRLGVEHLSRQRPPS